ncbi:MAG: hypothetical protein LCH54_07660 [Bacteroidetes bacterium]|nr:hypothetical protein [Bacteroidota bacterium]
MVFPHFNFLKSREKLKMKQMPADEVLILADGSERVGFKSQNTWMSSAELR